MASKLSDTASILIPNSEILARMLANRTYLVIECEVVKVKTSEREKDLKISTFQDSAENSNNSDNTINSNNNEIATRMAKNGVALAGILSGANSGAVRSSSISNAAVGRSVGNTNGMEVALVEGQETRSHYQSHSKPTKNTINSDEKAADAVNTVTNITTHNNAENNAVQPAPAILDSNALLNAAMQYGQLQHSMLTLHGKVTYVHYCYFIVGHVFLKFGSYLF